MAKIIGRQFQFGIAKEATRGTIASITYWLPYMDLTIDEKRDKVHDEQAFGIIEDAVGSKTTNVRSEGSVSGNIGDQSFGLLLYAVLGTLTSHAAHSGESTVYDNIFNVAETTQHQSLTFAVHDPATSQDYAYPNGVVEKLDLDFSLKQFAKFTATIKAITGTAESPYTPSVLSENHWVPQYMTLDMAPSSAGLVPTFSATGTAATTIHVTALSIKTDKITVGMTVSGVNIPSGTTVATIVSATAFDLSQASTGNAGTLYFGTLAGTGTASSTTAVTSLAGLTTSKLQVGMSVLGTNIPAGTTVAAIVSSSAFTLSAATTGAAADFTFGPLVVALKSAKISINGNVEEQLVLGSVNPADFLNKEFHVEMTVEAIWQNESDFKTLFMSDTSQGWRFDVKNTDVTIGLAANPELIVQFDKVHVLELGRPIKVKDLVYQTIKARAYYSTTDSQMVTTTLTITVNGY